MIELDKLTVKLMEYHTHKKTINFEKENCERFMLLDIYIYYILSINKIVQNLCMKRERLIKLIEHSDIN